MYKILFTCIYILFFVCAIHAESVNVSLSDSRVTEMSNGLISITIGSNGRISKMSLKNGTNVIGSNGVYFDYTSDKNRALSPTEAIIVRHTDDYAEVVYSNTSSNPKLQQGFIIRSGVSGVYSYIVVNGTKASEQVNMREMRVCTRLASNFLNGYVDDKMQGQIPSNSEMKTAEQAETTIADATYRMADGSIYTKYNWGQYIVKDSVHGLMSDNTGVWNIACSHEWANGGPMKQELTVHATSKSPITIQMLQGEHFGASSQYFKENETKIYGPFLIYLNQGTKQQMIDDAKKMAMRQQQEWPFSWFTNELFPKGRATVKGKINVTTGQSGDGLQVVLAEPGADIYSQGKNYIYWGETSADGSFNVPNVRPGNYSLYAYAKKGDITDELTTDNLQIEAGDCDLGTINWTPKKYENLLWMIGENNRLSDGFHLSDTLRSYLLPETVPADLTYTIGKSNPAEDWYYAQTKKGKWTVLFDNDKNYSGQAYLTASLAAVTNKPTVTITLNGTKIATWAWNTNDGAIYRSANQSGRHDLKTVSFDATLLKQGENTVTFELTNGTGRNGIMWDCIKLEAGTAITNGIKDAGSGVDNTTYVYKLDGTLAGVFHQQAQIQLPHGIYIIVKKDGSRISKQKICF